VTGRAWLDVFPYPPDWLVDPSGRFNFFKNSIFPHHSRID
jgi:hypothetical protein